MDEDTLRIIRLLVRIAIIVIVVIVLRRIIRGRKQPSTRPPVIPPRAGPAPPARTPAAPVVPVASPTAQRRTLNLDPGDFKPISGMEASKEAASLGSLWRDPFFGRRDLIPPADDPRTSIIDRAMVGQGLITPEELTEIHKTGQQMDAVRPDLALAVKKADDAVALDREARAEFKRRKKEEAAERKRLRAEAIRHRRATDIIYLGRGVSKGLADRRSNIEKLQAAGMPVLATPADVAKALGLTIPRLRWLAFHSEASGVSHYVRFSVPKKSGGTRMLSSPHKTLATAQEWILTNILEKAVVHRQAHGFVQTRSTVTNAQRHTGQKILVNTDLKDFFPTITFRRVAGIFRQLGYSPAVATVLGLLCTDTPRRQVIYAGKPFHVATGQRGLPQGACTSPMLSNLASRRLDSRLNGIAAKLGWQYTRYADDLSFSSSADGAAEKIGYVLARIRHISQDEGFAVNEAKTRVARQSTRQLVTGVVVNQRPGVERKKVRRIRAILHRAKREGLAAQNREKIPHFEAWLSGMISYIHMVNPKQAAPLRAALDALK